ncbi:MAG: hypothetical protein HeimC3_17630 [Candidatus Heimdallarchaeota archaeon LC_3]|nr:MAG: hypothetical protein HeimC3_17630 [Candidatus Heimdallarchaeota archaeon LC_3]
MVKMSENYVRTFEDWEKLMQLRIADEKKKKGLDLSSAFILLASTMGDLTIEKEYRLFRAMSGLIQKENTFKLDDDRSDLVASILTLAAEIKRTQ